MSETRQAILGVLAAFISAAIILGSLTVSLVEGGARFAVAPTLTSTNAIIPTQLPGEPTFTPRPSDLPTATPIVSTPSNCDVPYGWISITIQPDDTLQSLATAYGTTIDELQAGNCLPITTINWGTILFVPPIQPTDTAVPPTETPTPTEVSAAPTRTRVSCTPHVGWPRYQVRPDDTLYSLAEILGVSVNTLQDANCMGSSTLIIAWSYIYVPHLPPTPVPYFTPTPRPSFTATLPVSTSTPRPTPPTTPPPTSTTPAPTFTPITPTTPVPPSNTPTLPPAPTATPAPSSTTSPPVTTTTVQ